MNNKVLVIILIFFVCIYLIIKPETTSKTEIKTTTNINNEIRSVFVSYLDIENMVEKDSFKDELKLMIKRLKKYNFNEIIIQVRPFSDALYKSNIYPYSYILTGKESNNYDFDVLDYIIKLSKENNIKVNAWINPYRIRSNDDISTISKHNPAYKYINTNVVGIDKSGIYYNPANDTTNYLLIEGIKELVNNYDIDKILFDDYFYPSFDIDKDNYIEYKDSNGKLSLKKYRLNIIFNMIKRVYKTIKDINPDIEFGISPQGNIDNNYNDEYLDIERLLSKEKYIDYVMPQIYFGFKNESRPFKKTIKEWNNLIKNDVSLVPALAFYKIGKKDVYAARGYNEWIEDNKVISKQITYSRKVSNYTGFSLFRYDNIFDTKNKEILENLYF